MNYNLGWSLAAHAVAAKVGTVPLAQTTHDVEVGKWRLVLNNSRFAVVHRKAPKPSIELEAYEIYCENLEYLSFGLLGRDGGLLGGYPEQQFIDDMLEHLPSDVIAEYQDIIQWWKEQQS